MIPRFCSSLLALLLPVLATATPPDLDTDSYREPFQEFDKRLKAAREVGPLGGEAFGENVSLYNGATEFNVVDIAVPGNSALAVEARRRFRIEDPRNSPRPPGLGDWELDLPHMVGTFMQSEGWKVGTQPSASDQRCSFALPPSSSTLNFTLDVADRLNRATR